MSEMRIEYVAIDAVLKWPRNPKLHDENTLDSSIERFGYVQPLLFDETSGRLVAGHGRLDALQRRKREGKEPPARVKISDSGAWLVPVVRGVGFANEQEAEAFLLVDNRLVELGGWDDKQLAEMLESLQSTDGIDSIGWSGKEIDRLIADTRGEVVIGTLPEQAAVVYEEGAVKQMVFYFSGDEFDSVISRMAAIMDSNKLGSHTELFMHLLNSYDGKSA
jgi:hypothetical protein